MPENLGWILIIIVMVSTIGIGAISLLLMVFPPKKTNDLTGKRVYAIYLIGALASTFPFSACTFAYYPLIEPSLGFYFVLFVLSALFGVYIAKRLYNAQLMIAQASQLADSSKDQ